MGRNKPEQTVDELHAEIAQLKSELGRYRRLEEKFKETLYELHVHQEELRTQNDDLAQAHCQIADAHAKYLELFDYAPIGYFLVNHDGIIIEANLTAANWLGRTRNLILGKPLWIYLDKSQRDQFSAHLRSLKEGQPALLETVFLRNEKEQVPVELHSIPARTEDGNPTTCRIAVIDASRRKTAETALQTTNHWLDSILGTIPDIVYRLDDKGYIQFINHAVRNYGYEPEELLNKHYLTLIHLEDRDTAQFRINERRTGDRHTRDFEIRFLTRTDDSSKIHTQDKPGPTFSISASGLYLEGGDGSNRLVGTQGIAHDITSRKQKEQEQLELKEQLQRARRMEAIGTLAGGIAHDFNNIMTGIQGSASILHLLHPESKKNQDLIGIIEKSMLRGKDLTGQLLGYARGGKYVVKATNLNDLLASSRIMFNPTQKNIEFIKSFEQNLWNVQTDHGQMEQVFLNMLINAGQAMPSGGTLQLCTMNEIIDKDEAKLRDIAVGKFVQIVIKDTGVGMDQDTCSRIFEPFFTTKPNGRGTGLGLASAYSIIKNHAGSIQVKSSPGHGTTFDILLPASPE